MIPPDKVGNVASLDQPWSKIEFVFFQTVRDYTPAGEQKKQIPGFIIRIPATEPNTGAQAHMNPLLLGEDPDKKLKSVFNGGQAAWRVKDIPAAREPTSEDYLLAVSRICVHLGCIFNFETDQNKVEQGYGGFRPPNPVFACPCHFSIYSPMKDAMADAGLPFPGPQVISGPAPRPPRWIAFKVEPNGDIFITAMEEGGVA